MRNSITENEIEEIALGYLQSLGYNYLNDLVISPDGKHPCQFAGKYLKNIFETVEFEEDAAISKMETTEIKEKKA